MGRIYVSVGKIDNYFGTMPFKIGSLVKLQKESKNQKDSEAIKVVIPKIGKVGYVMSGKKKADGTYSAGRIYDYFNRKIYGKVCFVQGNIVIVKLQKTKKRKSSKKYIKMSLEGLIAEGHYPNLNKRMRKIFSFYRNEHMVADYQTIVFEDMDFENLPYEQLKMAVDGYYGNKTTTAARLGLWAKQINNILRQTQSALVFGNVKLAESKIKSLKVALSCFCDALALIDEDLNPKSTSKFSDIIDSYDDYMQK